MVRSTGFSWLMQVEGSVVQTWTSQVTPPVLLRRVKTVLEALTHSAALLSVEGMEEALGLDTTKWMRTGLLSYNKRRRPLDPTHCGCWLVPRIHQAYEVLSCCEQGMHMLPAVAQ